MIKKSEMVCKNCVFYCKAYCRLAPRPWKIGHGMEFENCETYWCGQGEWNHYSPSTKMMELYRWGEGREDA